MFFFVGKSRKVLGACSIGSRCASSTFSWTSYTCTSYEDSHGIKVYKCITQRESETKTCFLFHSNPTFPIGCECLAELSYYGYSPCVFNVDKTECIEFDHAERESCCIPRSGICGSSAGGTYCSKPSSYLCDSGDVSWINSWSDPFIWRCSGSCGGDSTTCTATYTPPTVGTSGVCGSSDGGIFPGSPPSSNLCSVGTLSWTDDEGSDGDYNWNCLGTAGSCGGASGSTANCSALSDMAPSLDSLVIENNDSEEVVVESGSRNHICQSDFKESSNPDIVRFVVTGDDMQGVDDINTIQLRLRPDSGNTFTSSLISSSNGIAIFSIDVSLIEDNTYSIEVLINDNHNPPGNDGWIDTGRDIKVWDCNVVVSGVIYDGSAGGLFCPSFGSDRAVGANFTSLYFKENGVDAGVQNDVDSVNISYSSGSGQYFSWGDNKYYSSEFNSDLQVDENTMQIKLNNDCTQPMGSFEIESVVDSYVVNPSLVIDFLATVDQEAWFQSVDGGIFAGSTITNYVPITCDLYPGCSPGMSLRALVAAPTLNNTVDAYYSYPDNWYINSNLSSYLNFYEQYKALGVGENIEGDLEGDLDDLNNEEELFFINGDLTITDNNSVAVGEFLMVMASGDIYIDESVTNVEGILVGRNIVMSGTNNSQLVINGSLYALENISNSRSYIDKSDNNSSPAVLVNFRPDFVFHIPNEISQKITSWKWGN